jgi:enterochelin esterase family protein
MKKITLFFCVSLIGFSIYSQSFSYFIEQVNMLPINERQAAVDNFMSISEPKGIPYINTDTANFIYLGEANTVGLPGDYNEWETGAFMLEKITGTDFWYFSKTFEMDARLDYKFILNGVTWITDPLNPNYCMGGYGSNSELAMPDYIQPWEVEENPEIEHGSIESFMLDSENTASSFGVKVYLPPNFDPEREDPYPVAYFQDGYEYISLGSADMILDNLIEANLMDPIIGVFVRPNNRNEEYAGNLRNEYRLFFVEELVPYIDAHYPTMKHSWGRAAIGASFGGNISTLIAYNHADVFGLCGLHSGAFWPNEWEAFFLVTEGEQKDIKFFSIWGSYEGLAESLQMFGDSLQDSGYDFEWLELPEGHSWGLWRATLDNILTFFFPPGYAGINNEILVERNALKIVPNPVKNECAIHFPYDKYDVSRISLQTISGKELYRFILHPNQLNNHKYLINCANIPNGIYLVIVTNNDTRLVEKLIKK